MFFNLENPVKKRVSTKISKFCKIWNFCKFLWNFWVTQSCKFGKNDVLLRKFRCARGISRDFSGVDGRIFTKFWRNLVEIHNFGQIFPILQNVTFYIFWKKSIAHGGKPCTATPILQKIDSFSPTYFHFPKITVCHALYVIPNFSPFLVHRLARSTHQKNHVKTSLFPIYIMCHKRHF